jgi:hypothetical protein
MLTELKHGVMLNTVSKEEMESLLREYTTRQQTRERVRASADILLDGNGAGTVDVYKVPLGYELEVRRVAVDLTDVTPATFVAQSINLATAGVALQYLRSGTRIEWALPQSSLGGFRVPGIETWGSQQGPYLQNGEIFQVEALLGRTGGTLIVNMEGILTKAGSLK